MYEVNTWGSFHYVLNSVHIVLIKKVKNDGISLKTGTAKPQELQIQLSVDPHSHSSK